MSCFRYDTMVTVTLLAGAATFRNPAPVGNRAKRASESKLTRK